MNEQFWNCGCGKWMHGIEDACDLYLPERKPADPFCRIVVEWERWQRNALARAQYEAMRAIPRHTASGGALTVLAASHARLQQYSDARMIAQGIHRDPPTFFAGLLGAAASMTRPIRR